VDGGQPSADLLISSAMDLQVKLVNDGYAASHWSSETDGIPDWAMWRHQAFGFTFEPAVIVYNRDLVPPEDVPQTRFDLLRLLRDDASTYQGRIVTYDVEQSGVGYLLATQDAVVGGVFGSLIETFGQNGVALEGNTSDMLEGIAGGRYLIGYNVLGSYAQAWAEGNAPIGIVLPRDYTLTISRTAVISAHAGHAEEAHRFLDYLLSVRGQRVLTDGGRLFAVRPEVTGPFSRTGISESRVGPLRSIQLGPGLLVYLDQLKRAKFLSSWREGVRQVRPRERDVPRPSPDD
ncbi:MAG TPA: ABC transporter substrate-binding protein, partial [Alphaproteobacteria bacterium]|nr:ABC transporter substrate-binding protein [Alphaproteobacteria bacterium]